LIGDPAAETGDQSLELKPDDGIESSGSMMAVGLGGWRPLIIFEAEKNGVHSRSLEIRKSVKWVFI
jgi:hypothetical protein